jgi:hypothetical protein
MMKMAQKSGVVCMIIKRKDTTAGVVLRGTLFG